MAIEVIVDLIDLVNEYFLVCFTNEIKNEHALFGGLWMIANHYLIVRQ